MLPFGIKIALKKSVNKFLAEYKSYYKHWQEAQSDNCYPSSEKLNLLEADMNECYVQATRAGSKEEIAKYNLSIKDGMRKAENPSQREFGLSDIEFSPREDRAPLSEKDIPEPQPTGCISAQIKARFENKEAKQTRLKGL